MRRVVCTVLALAACHEPRPVPDGGADDEVRAVYAVEKVAPLSLATRLCRVLHRLPEERRARCCGAPAGITFETECARALSISLRDGAVELDPARVDACSEAMQAALAGCEWVGPHPVLPAACQGLLDGRRGQGQTCRSSLECRPGLRCRGVGPTDFGRCDVPGAPMTFCGTAVDTLASYTRQATEPDHPECAGWCDQRRCTEPVPEGGACYADAQCGRGGHCAAGRCMPGAIAREGAPCVPGGCERGLRCIEGACRRPKASGERCTTDAECLEGCVRDAGVCATRCDVR